MRIVIVEDEKKIRAGMAGMISKKTPHTVVGEASDGEEGLEVIQRTRPELVITDIRMPIMDGLEMVRRLKEADISCHVIVLSGFSEFVYAKQAISYGVDEYLLKPLTAADIQKALEKIEAKIEEELLLMRGTPESCLRELVGGSSNPELLQAFQPGPGMGCFLAAAYLGSMPKEYGDIVQRELESLNERFAGLSLYSSTQENNRTLYALAVGGEELEECKNRIYKRLIRGLEGQKAHPLWACSFFEDEREIPSQAKELQELLTYGITAPGFAGWYTREWAASRTWEEFRSPVKVIQRIKNAVCQEHLDEAGEELEEFLQYFESHQFRKEEIRQGLMRGYLMVLDLLQELDKRRYQRLQNCNTERLIREAMTWNEARESCRGMREVLRQESARRQDISNYVILKVLQYIRDHYKEKIVLEQVAEQMGMTPEYLSTLFNREMKENFSVFLKKFRISHAKRLLTGTQMKIYEVAQEVGYSDAKYFTRVFKEEEGISPGDYREMQR